MKLTELLRVLQLVHDEHGDVHVVLGAGCWYGLASRVRTEEVPVGMRVVITSEECH